MAITINSTPSFGSSYNQQLFIVATSTNIAQTDFKYIVDIYIGGLIKSRQYVYPFINGKMYKDVAPVARGYAAKRAFNGEATFISDNYSTALNIEVKIGEYYANNYYYNLATTTITADNFINNPLEEGQVISSNYGKFLSDFTNEFRYIDYGKSWRKELYIDTAVRVRFVLFNGTATHTTPYVTYPTERIVLNITEGSINSLVGSVFLTKEKPLTITAQFETSYPSVTLNYEHKTRCQYEGMHLIFVNRWGGFDSYNFGLTNKQEFKADKSFYEQQVVRYEGNNVTLKNANNVYHQTNTQYAGEMSSTLKLLAQAPSDEDYKQFWQLVFSPLVYVQINNYYLPVTINNSNYGVKNYLNDRLQNLELELNLNQNRNTIYA